MWGERGAGWDRLRSSSPGLAHTTACPSGGDWCSSSSIRGSPAFTAVRQGNAFHSPWPSLASRRAAHTPVRVTGVGSMGRPECSRRCWNYQVYLENTQSQVADHSALASSFLEGVMTV